MNEQGLNDVLGRKFWLGQLSPEEQGRIEELAFEDSDTFIFLETVEDDLIDDFIQGELSPEEISRFEDHFLGLPGRRDNLEASRVLQRHLDTDIRPSIIEPSNDAIFEGLKSRSSGLRWSLIAAVFLLLIVALWLFIRARETARPNPTQAGPTNPVVTPSVIPSVTTTPTPIPAHVENILKTPSEERHQTVATIVLMPGTNRSGEAQQVSLTNNSPVLLIELHLNSVHKDMKYNVVLQNEAGATLNQWSSVKPKQTRLGRGLHVEVSIASLRPQEIYTFVVTGTLSNAGSDEAAPYFFEAIQ
jgi:hypothetical protein